MKPTLIINREVYDEIMYYVHRSEYEVSGMGKVVVEPNGILRVVSQIMLPQKNRYTHTQVEPEDINKLLFEMGESPRFWWHSHVKMGVFWSGEDMDTIKVNAGPNGWFVNTVFNQKGESKTAYYSAKGLVTPWGDNPVWYDDCEMKLGTHPFTEEWEARYLANVTNLSSYSSYGKTYDWQKGEPAGEPKAGNPPFKTGSSDTMIRAAAKLVDLDQEPPAKRPINMTKKLYKLWKLSWRRKQIKEQKELALPGDTDVYGFTTLERKALAEAGITDRDVDAMFEEDFTPSEILELVRGGVMMEQVANCIECKMSASEVMTWARKRQAREDLKQFANEVDAKITEAMERAQAALVVP